MTRRRRCGLAALALLGCLAALPGALAVDWCFPRRADIERPCPEPDQCCAIWVSGWRGAGGGRGREAGTQRTLRSAGRPHASLCAAHPQGICGKGEHYCKQGNCAGGPCLGTPVIPEHDGPDPVHPNPFDLPSPPPAPTASPPPAGGPVDPSGGGDDGGATPLDPPPAASPPPKASPPPVQPTPSPPTQRECWGARAAARCREAAVGCRC